MTKLVEEVAKAIASERMVPKHWVMWKPEARAAIEVVLRAANQWEVENQSLRDNEDGVVAIFARENGIEL